jgi:hypothetical protein
VFLLTPTATCIIPLYSEGFFSINEILFFT